MVEVLGLLEGVLKLLREKQAWIWNSSSLDMTLKGISARV